MNDYQDDVNRIIRTARRRRKWAWAGMVTGTCTGAIGVGSLIGLSGGGQVIVLVGVLVWFAWSLLQLR